MTVIEEPQIDDILDMRESDGSVFECSAVPQKVLERHSSRDLAGHLLVLALLLVLPLLVPVLQTLWQRCVFVYASGSLHKVLISRLLCKRTFAQQLHHVALVQNLLLQQPQCHLQDDTRTHRTGSKLCMKHVRVRML